MYWNLFSILQTDDEFTNFTCASCDAFFAEKRILVHHGCFIGKKIYYADDGLVYCMPDDDINICDDNKFEYSDNGHSYTEILEPEPYTSELKHSTPLKKQKRMVHCLYIIYLLQSSIIVYIIMVIIFV